MLKRFRVSLQIIPVCLLLGILSLLYGCSGDAGGEREGQNAVPVEVSAIEHGTIRAIRTFSGSLEASASFMVSPKVSGRVVSIAVDIGDAVERGAVVAKLDADEYAQDLAQSEAERLVAQANLAQAESALEIARRSMQRADALRQRGVTSDADLDSAKSELLASEAAVEVYKAELNRADAAVSAARIRLSYTEVQATWSGDGGPRYVAERYIDEGQTVAANTELLRIVDLSQLIGVFHVTEKDYANLSVGQTVTVQTDVYPGETFSGEIERIAPVFQDASRQARVEIEIDNSDLKLKPGLFIRAQVEVGRADEAIIVPEASILTRSDVQGIFLVTDDGRSATWAKVQVGIREGSKVQVLGEALSGQVVTLGLQLLKDGSAIRIANQSTDPQSAKDE